MIPKRCFLQWFVMTLACAVGGFYAWYTGLPQEVWRADMTHMTSVIAGVFVLAVGYLGFASWRFDKLPIRVLLKTGNFSYDMRDICTKRDSTAHADIGIAHWAGVAVIYVGLIGTVIGLMSQLHAMGSIDPTNPQSGITFLGVTVRSLATAFYATGAGLVAATLLSAMTQNLTYFLDREVAE